jgi:cytochrome P450
VGGPAASRVRLTSWRAALPDSGMEFDPLGDEVVADPYPLYRWFRDHQPLARNEALGVWFLFRFADVLQVLHDGRRFVSGQGVSLDAGDPTKVGRTLISSDDPVHAQLRSAISAHFTPRAVSQFEPRVRAIAREHLDGFAARGSSELMSELAIPVPIIVVGDLLGVRPEDRAQFRTWADALVQQDSLRPETGLAAKAAAVAIGEYFAGVIAERRANPADDLISALLATSVEGAALPLEDLLGFAFLLIVAGTETTTNLVGNAALALDAAPDQRRRLIDDPSLVVSAVEEVLRWDAPVQGLARVAVEDVTIGGGTLPAGSRVQLRFGSANRDEREFGDSDRFDVGRNVNRHVGLGHGIHYCLGASLARLEGRVMLEELLRRVPDWSVESVQRHPSSSVRGPASLQLAFSPAP